MNKQKMTLAVIGGVFGLAVLVMGYLVFSAYSAKTAAIEGDDGVQGLDAVVASVGQLLRKEIYPSDANVKMIGSNVTAVTEWKESALKQASRGDRFFDKTTPAAFKTMVIADAKRLVALPGSVDGKVAKPDFGFGSFREYIADGKMPDEAQLSVLQRQWDDVMTLFETVAKCGVNEITALDLKANEPAPEVQVQDKGKKNKKAAKKPVKKPVKGKSDKAADAKEPCQNAYVLTFTAKPSVFVKVVNVLSSNERFVVIDDFSFAHEADTITQSLGGEVKKAQEPSQAGNRRRRRGQGAEPAAVEKKAADADRTPSVVTAPENEKLVVTLKLSVIDFRSLEEPVEEKNGEDKK